LREVPSDAHERARGDLDEGAAEPPDVDEGAPEEIVEEPDVPAAQATPEEVADAAREFVTGLVETMELRADIDVRIEDGRAVVDVTGEGLGVLIGRRGMTLDALQEVARTAVQRRLRSRVRLLVDVEGYRARRRASLADYARAMARRARERGTEIELEPMNAYERKVVHDAVADVEGATSFSEGEEPNRKVIVRAE
jgi:spoIIIJ-associated protein